MCAAGKKRIAKKAILAAMNTNERVVEIRPKKKFRPVRDLNHDLRA